MNCKPGDLAIHVRAVHPENIGLLVEVLSFIGWAEKYSRVRGPNGRSGVARTTGFFWWVRTSGGRETFTDDAHLRPITPPPGTVTTDEVTELYSPTKVPA